MSGESRSKDFRKVGSYSILIRSASSLHLRDHIINRIRFDALASAKFSQCLLHLGELLSLQLSSSQATVFGFGNGNELPLRMLKFFRDSNLWHHLPFKIQLNRFFQIFLSFIKGPTLADHTQFNRSGDKPAAFFHKTPGRCVGHS